MIRQVEVDLVKLRDYCLSATHPRGKHKARIFESILGLTSNDAETLRQTILAAVQQQLTSLEAAGSDEFGQRYLFDLPVTTVKATATVRSLWIVRTGEDVLRFVSCYVI